MPTFSTLQALKITGVSRSRIDQMISRGFLELRSPPLPGRGREFCKNELAEIMALEALISMGIDIGSSEMMVFMPLKINYYFEDGTEPVLLLVRRHNRLIPTSERGSQPDRDKIKMSRRFGSILSLEMSSLQRLKDILEDVDLIGVTVIRLSEILARATAAEEMSSEMFVNLG